MITLEVSTCILVISKIIISPPTGQCKKLRCYLSFTSLSFLILALCFIPFFLKILFIHSWETQGEAETQAEGEAAPCREPNAAQLHLLGLLSPERQCHLSQITPKRGSVSPCETQRTLRPCSSFHASALLHRSTTTSSDLDTGDGTDF